MDPHVIVICEECGRKYRVDPERILGRAAGFSCRACGHPIRVVKPAAAAVPSGPERIDTTAPEPPGPPPFRSSGIGLRAKAWLIWFAAPVLVLAGAAGLLVGPSAAPGGPTPEETRQILLLSAAGLLGVLAVGLGYGLRLIGRVGQLAAAAERIAAGTADAAPVPDSGDDLDRVAAALRDVGNRLRSGHGPSPR